MATIQVEGRGKATAAPDEIELQLTVASFLPEYGQALEDLDRKIVSLKDAFVSGGLERATIKTQDFSVNIEREYREDGKDHFSGYRATHTLVVRVPLDRQLLNALLAACPASDATPEVNIRFRIRDQLELQRQALEAAFIDARKSAELLARSSGGTLGELVEMQYGERRGPTTQNYRVSQEAGRISYCKTSYADQIEPENIVCSEQVSATWKVLNLNEAM